MKPRTSSVVTTALCALTVGLLAAPRAHAAGSNVIANPTPPPEGAIQVGFRGERVQNIQVRSGNRNDAVWLANQFNSSLWAYMYSGDLQVVAPDGTFGMADFPPSSAPLPLPGTMGSRSQFPGAAIAILQVQSGYLQEWVRVEIRALVVMRRLASSVADYSFQHRTYCFICRASKAVSVLPFVQKGFNPMQCSRRTKSTILKIIAASIGIFAALGASQSAQATILFATSYEGKSLVKVDTSAMTTSTLFNTPSGPTGLIFDTSGRIIYTELVTGQVRRFDPNTNTDVLLASGLSTPLELTLEPGGNSVLVSDTNASKIDRIDLTTNALSTLTSDFLLPAGITYDSAGRLFVDTLAQVFELDPTTGAPLQSSRGLTNMNGLAFDSFTGDLFASSVEGVTIYQFSPGNLNSASTLTMDIRGPGGLVSDGLGNLFVASLFDSHIYQYNLATNTLTQNVFVAGLYDLALAPGLGTTPPPGVVPEPSSVALLMTGGLPLLGLLRRRLSA